MAENGSFEIADLTGWRTRGNRVESKARSPYVIPFHGERVAEIWPRDGEDADLFPLTDFAPFKADDVLSATLEYRILGHSLDELRNNDSFGAYIHDPTFQCGAARDCFVGLDLIWNQDASSSWQARRFDIRPQITDSRWGKWRILFTAENSFINSSWWHLDSVSIRVCTK